MNESHIERLLGSLKPASPSEELMQRVQHDMELQSFFRTTAIEPSPPGGQATVRRSTWHVPVAWASVGAAAAAALVISLMPPREFASGSVTTSAPVKKFTVGDAAHATPVSTNRQVLSAEDRGVVYSAAEQPTRQIRVRSIERRLVIDAATGAQTIIEVPVEEIISVPVQVQ
jgi:hypothetical protein